MSVSVCACACMLVCIHRCGVDVCGSGWVGFDWLIGWVDSVNVLFFVLFGVLLPCRKVQLISECD